MNKVASSLGSELRTSPRSAIIALGTVAVAILLLSGGIVDPYALQMQIVGLLLGTMAGLAWLLAKWNSIARR